MSKHQMCQSCKGTGLGLPSQGGCVDCGGSGYLWAKTDKPNDFPTMPGDPPEGPPPAGDDEYVDADDRLPEVSSDEVRDLTREELAADAGKREGEQCDHPTVVVQVQSQEPSATCTFSTKCNEQSDERGTDTPTFLAQQLAQLPVVALRKYPLTDEQQAIVDAVLTEQVLVIEAGAGAGKTSTLLAVSEALPGRGQYTAFNASLVAESKGKFDLSRTPCNTVHSMAFRSEGYRFKHRLNGPRTRGSEVAAMLRLSEVTVKGVDGKDKVLSTGLLAGVVARAVKKFTQSADKVVDVQHFGKLAGLADDEQQEAVTRYLLPFARKMWEDQADPDGRMPYNADCYVKVWELQGAEISGDYLLIDERQDLSMVQISIAKQQEVRGMKVVLVGDAAQAIYGWRGCADAAAAFPNAKRLCLSMSFRFGPVIAEVANSILSHLQVRSPLVMKGHDKIPSRLGTLASPDCVLCRTNGGAVQTVLTAIGQGKRPHLIGGGADVLAFVRASRDLKSGKRTEHPELACFDSWGEVEAYAKTEDGEDLKVMVKLIKDFGVESILKALNNMPDEKDADLVVSTAHKSKGREWDRVKLCGDFKPLSKMDDEEIRLLYVAATRAKLVLDVESCPPFCGGGQREDACDAGDGEDEWKERRRQPVVDLTEARRLSRSIQVDEAFATGTPPPVQAPAPKQEPKRDARDEGNTWAKLKGGGWGVRGLPGQKGAVKVVRRNGSTSTETLGKQVWVGDGVALYEVVSK